MPTVTLVSGLLEVGVHWSDASAGVELAADGNRRHALRIEALKDDRLLGANLFEIGRLHKFAAISWRDCLPEMCRMVTRTIKFRLFPVCFPGAFHFSSGAWVPIALTGPIARWQFREPHSSFPPGPRLRRPSECHAVLLYSRIFSLLCAEAFTKFRPKKFRW